VDRINAHDVGGLLGLMTTDHVFVDSLGLESPRPAIEEGWRQYFEMVPDYRVKIISSVEDGSNIILIGSAGGTYVTKGGSAKSENEWETPAVWVARIRGEKVAEWRVYCDNEPIRQRMRQEKR